MKIRVFDNRYGRYLEQFRIDNMLWYALNSKDYIVEQFTGLQDKNGKDIYLGDIVYYERDEENFEIGYDDTIGAISICNGDVCYTFDNLYGTELEVIGNINENAELLKTD